MQTTSGPPHILSCDDSAAVFIPWDFPNPLLVRTSHNGKDNWLSVGSTLRLADEIAHAAMMLGLPPGLRPDAFWEADPSGPFWRAHRNIGMACNTLRQCARHAVARAAFLLFC